MNFEDDTVVIPMPSGNGSVPVPNRVDRADFVDKIKPEQIVEVIRHKLLGEEWDGSKWIKLPELQEGAFSERGAWDISNLILGIGNINMSISKLNEHQINARLRESIKELLRILLSNWLAYKITNVGQLYYVKSITFSNSLAVLSQAGEGSIQELFKTTVQENRQVNTEKREPGKLRRLLGMN